MHITHKYANLTLVLLVCGGAHAATFNTTLSVNATATIGANGLTATGPATLTTIGTGTFSATVPLTGISGTTLTAPYTITLTGGAGTITGSISLPASLLTGTVTTATGSGTVTGGTGTFAGATGTFPSLSGSGSISPTGTITLSFSGAGTINTGGSGGPPPPTITLVASAADYSTTLAQGSLFIVKGSNLSASGFNQFSYPLPVSSGGVSITFTPVAGGTGTAAFLIYTLNQSGVNQLAAVLPSTLAAGRYNVTVTNSGATSAPFSATVAQRRFAMFTQDASGSGLAIVQNFISASQLDFNRFTTGTIPTGYTISPAKPGQALIAWGTGLGPITGGDNVGAPAFDFSANGVNVQVLVGGVSITPGYAGRAPSLSGEDQIVFTLPANVPTGCTVPLQVSVGGVLSPAIFIAIAPSASANACVSPNFTTAQLQNFDQGGTVTSGGFSLSQVAVTQPSVGTVKLNSASGAFVQYTGFQLSAIPAVTTGNLSVPCQILQISGTQSNLITGKATGLDAGTVTLNGPSGSNISNAPFIEMDNTYALTLATEGLPAGIPGGGDGKIVAGTYTLSGAGGKDVGRFNTSLTLGPPFVVTGGLPATINRSAGLTLSWTGGNPNDLVGIVGFSGTVSGTGANATTNATEFVCTTNAGAGTFTVPASILTQLPAVTAGAITAGTGTGFLTVSNIVSPVTFSAPLTAGGSISNATFAASVGTGNTAAYQ